MADDRTLAQFFFELGYGACWAEAAIRNGEKPPFDLTDAVIERAWAITPETYDDHAEFDEKLALVDSAPDMLAALETVQFACTNHGGECERDPQAVLREIHATVTAAIAKARTPSIKGGA